MRNIKNFCVQLFLSNLSIIAILFLLGGACARAQQLEIWTAASDNYTNGADWNPAITGTTTNWPTDNNGLVIASGEYNIQITNGGTCNYVGPGVGDPFDPNWTNTIGQVYMGPASGTNNLVVDGTNTFNMTGGELTMTDSGGYDWAVGGYSVNAASNNCVFNMSGGTLNVTNSSSSAMVGLGTNGTGIANFTGGTANFNGINLAGRGTAIVNISGGMVYASGIVIGQGSSGTLSVNGKGAGILNLSSGVLNVTNQSNSILDIGGRCNLADLNVSGGTLNANELDWGYTISGKITNTFNLSGGIVNIGSGGMTHGNTADTNLLIISGGTLSTFQGLNWTENGIVVSLATSPGPGVATFAPSAGTAITIKSGMSGSGALTLSGPGELGLAGPNTYAGTTTVSGGTLAIEAFQPNILDLNNTGGNIQIGPGLASSIDPLRDSSVSLPVGTSLIFSNTAAVSFTNVVTGSGGLFVGGGGTANVNAANLQYNGNTVINAGDLALAGTVSSLLSPTISIGPGGTLDVSQLPAFNLGNGQVVSDGGSLAGGNINFESGSTLALGLQAANINFSVSQSGNLTLDSGSTNYVALNVTNYDAGNNEVVGFSSVALGGTLVLSNVGSPFTAGEIIPLYNAGAYSGSFSSILPTTPGSGLVWDTSQLDVSGTLRVAPSIINPNAPSITQQPISTNINQGATLADTVVAGGSDLSYQWYQAPGSVAVNGQTSAALSFNPAEPGDGGDYYLVVSNASGVAVSAIISVTILPPTQITSQLPITYTNLFTLYAGASPRFSVTAAGVAPLTYQWYSNGVVVAGATGTNLNLAGVQVGMLTNYCIVTNVAGSVTTAVWLAQVIADPTNSAGGPAPYPQQVLALNPVGYWRLNDTNLDGPDNNGGDNGYICHDYAGGNDGLYTNVYLGDAGGGMGYNPVTDPSDNSAEFGADADGGSDAGDQDANSIYGINFGSPAGTSKAFTVEAWVQGYDNQISGAGLVTLGWGGGGEQFDMDVYTGNFRFFFRDASGSTHGITSTLSPSTTASLGPWYHLAAVVDEITNQTVTFYINGVPAGTASAPAGDGVLASTYPISIGARMSNQTTNFDFQFDGFMNDVSIFNYALSASQVANEYDAGGGTIAPYFSPTPPANATAAANTTLTIPVTAVGTPGIGYWWTNVTTGAGIESGIANNASGNVTLSYPDVPLNWNGDQLQLTVTNGYGTTNALFTITINNGVNANPTNIVASVTNSLLYLTWPADHTGWQLQAQTNKVSVGLGTNWVNDNPSTATNQVAIPINVTNGTVFYRLIYSP